MLIIGVHCKTDTCTNVIGLQEIREPPPEVTDNAGAEHPFIVKCDVCGESHTYTNDDLGTFEG